ncbi:putative nuclease HARBI1 [Rhopalosiphum padi]|uniref:putative nuclease HARBI1 n=1 Tax=Rhopalosiphum padi TaxID=40932 RepID=UPI00298D8E88|nr:putative nuclease HARBI1 [Rhopalosiphum padi]
MDNMYLNFLILNNIEHQENAIQNVRVVKEKTMDPFLLLDRLFVKSFRLTKYLANILINMLRPLIEDTDLSSAIDLKTKVLVTLHFFGTGSYQTPMGHSRFTALSQSSVSRCISDVVNALNDPTVFNFWVKFPSSVYELEQVRKKFYTHTGFPGIIGCIDCTYVAIVPPSSNLNLIENQHPEHIYVNRKCYHSINVQLICDSDLKILNVNALFPGSTHDAHIWKNSNVLPLLQDLYAKGFNNIYLLGDSGYPLRPWLLTPISNPTNEAEEYFNKQQMSARSKIERCNGVLKGRFRCLIKDQTLHYKPEKATKIINACVVLHNLCITYNVPEFVDGENLSDFGMYQTPLGVAEDNDVNLRNRDLMMGR